MKLRYRLTFSTMALCISSFSLADTVSIPYAGFYERLKQVNKANYQLVEIAFSVPKTNQCTIISGNITTEKNEYPLTFNKQQRLYLPFDAQLKSDRGLINLTMKGDSSECGVAMQVRAKEQQQSYDQETIVAVKDNMDALLDGQQGFPMKYFRKPISGVTFSFAESDYPVTVTIDQRQQIITEHLQVDNEQLAELSEISFSALPNIISPYVL
ncbi:DUF2987 domain-containing protein [Shewanella donghaensis]|uniref:DUF2987 domain-containing protein n=1 Tax=Shewanella donghaensis TaxID=238836 RepID=UPI0011824066|nr:DUF2987 domain-containing protein [Shewanella donghaensis]